MPGRAIITGNTGDPNRDERIAQHAKRDAMRPATAGEEEQADKPTKPDDANT